MTLETNETAQTGDNDASPVNFEAGRRAFIKSLGLGVAGVSAGALALSTSAAEAETRAERLDIEILTFALNLEYLEAEFYSRAATGSGLSVSDLGDSPGQVTGGRKVNFSSAVNAAYAQELASDEIAHVRFLRSAIVAASMVPISRPTIDFATSFTTAARAANLIGPSDTFDAFANDTNFLLASYIFEDVGVTAYHGALTRLKNNLYLEKASGIMATEAYHAGIVRTALFNLGLASQTNAISYLRQVLSGVTGTPTQGNDHGVGTTSAPTIVDADGDSIAWLRSVPQVLDIVYGDTSHQQKPGLFFPNGVNPPH